MKTPLPSVEQMNRLAKAMMHRHRLPYAEAVAMLGRLRLHLVLSPEAAHRFQYQAALLTAVNSGKRAFLGGVSVELPPKCECVLPGWKEMNLADVLVESGATVGTTSNAPDKTILIGGASHIGNEDAVLIADDWRGGFLPPGSPSPFADKDCSPLGAVFAVGVVVARAFMDVSGIRVGALDEAYGMSLWRPDLDWLDEEGSGPPVVRLPEKLWLLGLGHLGQAYLWTIGLFQFTNATPPTLFLHDFDVISHGNWCAGLLCEPSVVGLRKTRICANWAERRGFRTTLIERPFDGSVRVGPDEPRIALCGFDSASGRRELEKPGFKLVIECGLGSSLAHFDRMVLHTFPEATKCPEEIWPDFVVPDVTDFDRTLFGEAEDGECGILVDDLARKPVSAAFVGVAAAALVVGELLRGLHGGCRFEVLNVHLRSNSGLRTLVRREPYELRHAANGWVRTA